MTMKNASRTHDPDLVIKLNMTRNQREFVRAIHGHEEGKVFINTFGKSHMRYVHGVDPNHPIPAALIRRGYIVATTIRTPSAAEKQNGIHEEFLHDYQITANGIIAIAADKKLLDRRR